MGAPESEELMTTREVMAYLGISRMTLQRRMEQGRLVPVSHNPALDRPKTLLFRRADVERVRREAEERQQTDH